MTVTMRLSWRHRCILHVSSGTRQVRGLLREIPPAADAVPVLAALPHDPSARLYQWRLAPTPAGLQQAQESSARIGCRGEQASSHKCGTLDNEVLSTFDAGTLSDMLREYISTYPVDVIIFILLFHNQYICSVITVIWWLFKPIAPRAQIFEKGSTYKYADTIWPATKLCKVGENNLQVHHVLSWGLPNFLGSP